MATERSINVGNDILPVFVVREGERDTPTSFVGTGFVIYPGVFITCWHVVEAPLPPGHRYAAVQEVGGVFMARYLADITQDPQGRDLATAAIDLAPTLGLVLADAAVGGADVLTWGFPLTRTEANEGKLRFELQARYLEGYVTRPYRFRSSRFPPSVAYELDMPAPEGLSGAPLLRRPSRELLGVVFGSTEVYSITAEQAVDPETGAVESEARRVVSFAVAHHTDTLADLAGPATNWRPLRALLGGLDAVS